MALSNTGHLTIFIQHHSSQRLCCRVISWINDLRTRQCQFTEHMMMSKHMFSTFIVMARGMHLLQRAHRFCSHNPVLAGLQTHLAMSSALVFRSRCKPYTPCCPLQAVLAIVRQCGPLPASEAEPAAWAVPVVEQQLEHVWDVMCSCDPLALNSPKQNARASQ